MPKVDRFDTYDAQGELARAFQNPAQVGSVVLTGTSFSARRKLPHYLSHFAGETITNVARQGGNPLDPIFGLLRETEPGTPEILVLELPGHHSLLSSSTRRAVELYAEFPPSQQMLLFEDESWNRLKRPRPGPLPIAWTQPVAGLPKGLAAHDGEGLVAVRLRGELSGGSLRIEIRCAGARHDVLWPEGQEQLIIPVLTASATNELLVAMAIPQRTSPPYAVLDLHTVELIAALDESRAVRAGAGSGELLGEFPPGTLIPPHGGLLVRLRLAENPSDEVVLFGVVDGEERELGRYPNPARRGLIAVSLSALAGAELRSVRATGLDASRLIGRITLLPME
jgi:hypothetical protein